MCCGEAEVTPGVGSGGRQRANVEMKSLGPGPLIGYPSHVLYGAKHNYGRGVAESRQDNTGVIFCCEPRDVEQFIESGRAEPTGKNC